MGWIFLSVLWADEFMYSQNYFLLFSLNLKFIVVQDNVCESYCNILGERYTNLLILEDLLPEKCSLNYDECFIAL